MRNSILEPIMVIGKMEKKEEISVKKFRRKIKIRLLDSNDPDSYVCEVFDSSLEDDDDDIPTAKTSNSSFTKTSANLKSYFEILMSNDSRKSLRIDAAKENQEIFGKGKRAQDNLTQSNVSKSKEKKGRNKRVEMQVITSQKPSSDSSDDESLFQVRKKWMAANGFKTQSSKLEPEIEILNAESRCVKPSCDSELNSQKRNFLNLFTKNQTAVRKNLTSVGQIHASSNISTKKDPLQPVNNTALKECNQKQEIKSVNGVKKDNVKLAPVFLMRERKIIDLAAQKARYDFLHKETKLLKATDKVLEQGLEFQPVCHVQQRTDSPLWSVRSVPVPAVTESPATYAFKAVKVFRMNVTNCGISLVDRRPSDCNEETFNSVESDGKLLKELKVKYSNLNLDGVFDGLKCKKDKFKNLSIEMKRTKTAPNEVSGQELLNSLWTERYKPSSFEILGNERVVKKLRNWLQAWKTFNEELKNLAQTNRKNKKKVLNDDGDDDDDDDDVFVNSDDENFGLKAPVSVCLLSGPNGCGKTALVSSLANELEFNVLEVNASSKRTGKKVLAHFQEATKSHKVQHLTPSLTSQLNGFVKQVKKKRGKKPGRPKKDVPNKTAKDSTEKKISLLLIEDADIIFEEHDEGFYSAVSSLVQTSKRPFIFITDDSNCDQLDTFKTDGCLLLEMKRPPFHHACALLDAVSLLEGAPVGKQTLEYLLLQNNFDLRKSLLDLEFWKGPGEENLRRGEPFDLAKYWWGLPNLLYPENTTGVVESLQFKRKRKDARVVTSDDEEEIFTKRVKVCSEDGDAISLPSSISGKPGDSLELLSAVLDAASTLDLIEFSRSKELVPGSGYLPKCSLSLEENMETVLCGENHLREELCTELVGCSERLLTERRGTRNSKFTFSTPSWDDIRWRNSLDEAREELSFLVPVMNGRDERSVHLDYLPVIRNICRVERNRSITNNKRKNRFMHYFNNTDGQITEKTLNASCQMFGR